MNTILVVEDDQHLAEGLRLALGSTYQVLIAHSVAEGQRLYLACDLVLLDVNLPDGSGFDFLRQIRQQSHVPVVILSARDMEIDMIRGFEEKADDYITKPFSLSVLEAKIKRILERCQGDKIQSYRIGDFLFDFSRHLFYRDSELIHLTVTEEKLLRCLLEAKGHVVLRDTLIESIWAVDGDFLDNNTLNVHINRLRNKLGVADVIATVYGVGYQWNGI